MKVGKFPFTANSRASIVGQHEGFIKIVSDSRSMAKFLASTLSVPRLLS